MNDERSSLRGSRGSEANVVEQAISTDVDPHSRPASDVGALRVTLDDAGALLIRGPATVHNAAELLLQLKALDRESLKKVSIDLSGLTSMDTAGAQILIAFRRSVASTSVHSCPAEIRQFLETTDLTCLLTGEDGKWRS